MILLRQGIPIRKLKLSLWRISERVRMILDSSISSALQCQIQELEILVDHLGSSTVQVPDFPPEIFSCKSLVKLKLSSRGAVSSDLPDTVSLPNVKVLLLDLRFHVNEFSIQRLILGCPQLKDLHIGFISVRDYESGFKKWSKVLDFSCPSLNKLVLDSSGGECVTILVGSDNLETLDYRLHAYCDDGSEKVIVNAPNLKHLATQAPLCRLSFVESLNSLIGAKITADNYHVHKLSGRDVIDHLHRAQNVESICLGRVILEALHLHGCLHMLHTFRYLKFLEFEFKKDRRFRSSHMVAWKALPFFLKSAPNLEVLVFDHVYVEFCDAYDEGFESFLEAIFPKCSIDKLKGIEIKAFENQEYEFKIVEHLLQHGKALRKVSIGQLLEPSVRTKMLSFMKCSNLCQIVFV